MLIYFPNNQYLRSTTMKHNKYLLNTLIHFVFTPLLLSPLLHLDHPHPLQLLDGIQQISLCHIELTQALAVGLASLLIAEFDLFDPGSCGIVGCSDEVEADTVNAQGGVEGAH